jgi:hypothetical protein
MLSAAAAEHGIFLVGGASRGDAAAPRFPFAALRLCALV